MPLIFKKHEPSVDSFQWHSRGSDGYQNVLVQEFKSRLVLLAFCLTGLYGGLSLVHPFFLTVPEAVVPMVICSALSAVVSLGLGLTFRRGEHGPWLVYLLGFVLTGLLIVNSLLHLFLTKDSNQTTNLLLVVIGAAGIFVGYRDWCAALVIAWVSWFFAGPFSFESSTWGHYGFMLLLGSIMSLFLLTIRIRHRTQLELSRRELEEKAASLEYSNNALKNTERRLNEAQELVQIGSWQYELGTGEIWWSHEVFRMLGWSKDGVTPGFKQCCQVVAPEDRRAFRNAIKDLLFGGENIDREFRVVTGMGESRVLSLRGQTQTGGDGEVVRLSGTVQDVTEKRQQESEREVLESQLRSAQRMDALGTLAGGIAHDFNNILFSILGNAQLAEMDIPEEHPARKSIDNIVSASRRARDVVRQILTFSQRQDVSIEETELSQVVFEVLDLLRASLPPSIEIHTEFEPGCPPIAGDPSQIHQILVNLCSNAFYAMKDDGGDLKITVKKVWPDAAFLQQNPQLEPGAFVQLRVEDTGPGMGESTIERVFEPFFTTKSAAGGTGLGLAVVHGIVKSHRGAISVRSRLGQGTVFELFFPLLEVGAESEVAEEDVLEPGHGERILLVDDEVPVLRAVSALLSRLNYQVTECTNPLDAERLLQRYPNRFDLLLTDLRMREMLGTELARRISKLRPDLPVVLITGHAQELDARDLKSYGITCLVHKPTTLENLSSTIARVLADCVARAETSDPTELELSRRV